jgi:hypothetical protein
VFTFAAPTNVRRPVLDDDFLIETLRHRLGHEPRDNVERAAGRDRNDEADRLARIGVCMHERNVADEPAAPAAKCRNFRRPSFMYYAATEKG